MSLFLGQTSQGLSATEYPTSGDDAGGNFPEAIYQGNNESAGSGETNFNDSGFFESPTPGPNYKDFQLFDNLAEDNTDTREFFADADASLRAHVGSLPSEGNGSGVEVNAPDSHLSAAEDEALFTTTIQELSVTAVSDAVYEAIKDYDIRSQPSYVPPPSPQDVDVAVDPVRVWIGTHFRYERIAYQASYPVPESEK